jgi:RNA polymerase sigma factor (sigma-70 family)
MFFVDSVASQRTDTVVNRPNLDQSTVAERAIMGRLDAEYGARLRSALQWRIAPAMQARFDADDVVQETLIQSVRKWAGTTALPPFSYVYRQALDCLSLACRHEKRSKRNVAREVPLPEQSSMQFAMGLLQSSTSPASKAAQAEQLEAIMAVISTLKAEHREVLFMRHVDGLSSAEISEILKIELTRVHNRYAKAMARLRQLMHD